VKVGGFYMVWGDGSLGRPRYKKIVKKKVFISAVPRRKSFERKTSVLSWVATTQRELAKGHGRLEYGSKY